MRQRFTLITDNGKTALDYGLEFSERPGIPSPELEVETITIPGRDGSYTRKKGYKNIEVTAKFKSLGNHNFKKPFREIVAWLQSAKTIRLSDENIEYRVVRVVISDTENDIERYGKLEPKFELQPFAYDTKQKKIELTQKVNIRNPGTYFAKPKFTIKGTDKVTLIINDQRFSVVLTNGDATVDSELSLCYSGTLSLKNFGKYPRLETGYNSISWDGNVTALVIEPRWRFL